ncbi:MAG: hypothetical protein ACI4O4_08635, partial [Candidatus Ventricola sp.]
IITPDGVGTINAINVLEETVRVRIAVGDSFELREYPIDDCQRPEPQNAPHVEHADKADRGERPERGEKSERREKAAEKGEKPERRDKPEKGDRPERFPKGKRPERGEKPERGDRPEKGERAPRRADKPPRQMNAKPAAQETAAEARPQQENAPEKEADVLEIIEESIVEDLL